MSPVYFFIIFRFGYDVFYENNNTIKIHKKIQEIKKENCAQFNTRTEYVRRTMRFSKLANK